MKPKVYHVVQKSPSLIFILRHSDATQLIIIPLRLILILSSQLFLRLTSHNFL